MVKGTRWTVEMERDLLCTIITFKDSASIKWKEISDSMQEQGHGVNEEGCRQHFGKIKRGAKVVAKNATGSPSSITPRATPKRKGSTSTGRGRGKGKVQTEDEDDDDIENNPTPSKRPKLEREAHSATQFKIEDLEEDDDAAIDVDNDELYEA